VSTTRLRQNVQPMFTMRAVERGDATCLAAYAITPERWLFGNNARAVAICGAVNRLREVRFLRASLASPSLGRLPSQRPPHPRAQELEQYMPGLASRPCLLVANKADGSTASQRLAELRSQVAHRVNRGELASVLAPETTGASLVLPVSALQRRNLGKLASRMAQGLVTCRRLQADADARAAAAEAKAVQDAEDSASELEDGERYTPRMSWKAHGGAQLAQHAHKDMDYGWVRERDSG
jgi:hypothetical protein